MLQVCWFEVKVQATTPLVLNEHSGSAIRGAFFHALWERFCTNREVRDCRKCPYLVGCPVAKLVATSRGEWNEEASLPRGEQRHPIGYGNEPPQPYIVLAPQKRRKQSEESAVEAADRVQGSTLESIENNFQAGETFSFSVILVGASTKLFPFVLRAFQDMEQSGLGHRLPQNKGHRGRFQLQEVRTYHPFRHEYQTVWQRDLPQVQRPLLFVTYQDILTRAQQISTDQVTVHFLSPTSLKVDRHFLRRPSFSGLIKRSIDRLARLQVEYGESCTGEHVDRLRDASWRFEMGEQAGAIRLTCDQTQWVYVESHSSRQQRAMPISGIVGRATFEGDLTAFREVLAWGEVLRVGKSATKGNGYYHIDPSRHSSTEPSILRG